MRTRLARPLLLALLGIACSGCYEIELCGRETCDGTDDDCDGRIDEGFRDSDGLYSGARHCGACGIDCGDVFESALETQCVVADGSARCQIAACPDGTVLLGGACVEAPPVLCLPCTEDAECDARVPGARCLPAEEGGLCGSPCDSAEQCPAGFACRLGAEAPDAQCEPESRSCACSEEMDAEFACTVRSPDGDACAGVRSCRQGALSPCVPVFDEACNEADDDCDGMVDEGFVDGRGLYVGPVHCGACGSPCAAPGPNMTARCIARDDRDDVRTECELRCNPGFVDVDGELVTGCECQLMSDVGAVIGADTDCDGTTDETPDYIFVSQGGDDANDGEQVARAVRTIDRGLALGADTGRTVLVARGIYRGPLDLVGGVTLLGGYSPDFRTRDIALHPVVLERPAAQAGEPVLRCQDVTAATLIDGLSIVASAAVEPGAGSTALYFDGCGPDVVLSDVTVLAARAAPGSAGDDSSQTLAKWDLDSLSELDGSDGTSGGAGNADGEACAAAPGGGGGDKVCPRRAVSGGDGGAASCPDLSTLCDNATDAPCGNGGCTDFTSGGTCDLEAARAAAIAHPQASAGLGAEPGAAGEAAYASPTNRGVCQFCDDNPSLPRNGGIGGDGMAGTPGARGDGCEELELVDFDRGLITAGDGSDGQDGSDGSGGGGATAGAGYAVIGNTSGTCSDVSGGSGGGGGSGGCGAPGALGGGGGGASIGVLIRPRPDVGAGPTLVSVRIVTASGGDGGDGGIGAAGGAAGAGGLGGNSRFWCARSGARGGDGGPGGAGGGGGGGCGGGSYGIYLAGDVADGYRDALGDGAIVESAGVPGRGGAGGFSPGSSGGQGLDGRARAIAVSAP